MNLEQSSVLVDRALVTLCAELPESLGLYHTAKDEFAIGAIRSVPMLEHLLPESRKHHIIRDWMRTYVEHEDQPASADISFDVLREIMKKERKQRAKEARERNGELLSDDEDEPPKDKAPKTNGKAKAKISEAERKKAEAKAKRRQRVEESEEEDDDSDEETSSTPSTSESEDSSSFESDSDSDRERRRSRSKAKAKSKSSSASKAKAKERRRKAQEKKTKRGKSKSNLPPIEVVLSSDEEDEPDALFDADDPDVYEVESILDKRSGGFGQPDMYLIKWVGYEETTWEPAENVSKDLIDEFEGQPVRENEYVVEEILDRKTVRDKETRLKTFKYYVKWVGYDDKTWEPAENLPHNLRRKFDAKYEARKRRRMN